MATWTQPTANALSASTYIKDTDDKLQSTMDDLEDFVNSAGSYVGVGLTDDFVDKTNAQTIAGIKTFSATPVFSAGLTGDVTGNVTGNADTATAFIAGAAKTKFDSIESGATADQTKADIDALGINADQIDGKEASDFALLVGATFTGQAKGITPVASEDLTRKDYVDGLIPTGGLDSGTYTPTISGAIGVTVTPRSSTYTRNGNIVTVTGVVSIGGTTDSYVTFGISLPIATASASTCVGNIAGAHGISGSSLYHAYGTIYGEGGLGGTASAGVYVVYGTTINCGFTMSYVVS